MYGVKQRAACTLHHLHAGGKLTWTDTMSGQRPEEEGASIGLDERPERSPKAQGRHVHQLAILRPHLYSHLGHYRHMLVENPRIDDLRDIELCQRQQSRAQKSKHLKNSHAGSCSDIEAKEESRR
jgi:hypothetical protein